MSAEPKQHSEPLAPSEIRAIQFSLEELEAYVSAVGSEDDSHERHLWTIRKLKELLARFGEEPINAD